MTTEQQKLKDFLYSKDFMKLGQAINHEHWEAAHMALRRLDLNARPLKLDFVTRNIPAIRNGITSRNRQQALDALARITQRRVQLMNALNNSVTETH